MNTITLTVANYTTARVGRGIKTHLARICNDGKPSRHPSCGQASARSGTHGYAPIGDVDVTCSKCAAYLAELQARETVAAEPKKGAAELVAMHQRGELTWAELVERVEVGTCRKA
jgi:hypothetical protein